METNQKNKKLTKRTWVSIFIIIVLIPLVIWGGWKLGDRKYYLSGVAIIILTMIPFFMVFESRRPQAREIVIIAVMTAIATAARTAFIMIPNFKPMTAIIMITGIALGPEAGFLTGAMTGFVSNFIFGQGPWTPWQMFAFGIAGFIAGLLNAKGLLKTKPWQLAVFGAITVMVIVGPLLDTCALFTMANEIDTTSVGAVYLSGLPVNAVHAVATALTLLLFSKPMLEKLDRVKLKYGMMENN